MPTTLGNLKVYKLIGLGFQQEQINGFPLEEYVSEALLKKQTCRHGVHTTVKDYVMMCEDCDFIFGKFDPKNLLPSGVTPEECKHHITQTIGMSKICYNCSAVVKRLDNQVNA